MNRPRYSIEDHAFDTDFYEDVTLMRAQAEIGKAMKKLGLTKAELAQRLGKSKSAITRLLSDGRNLTLRSLGKILFELGVELYFHTKPIVGREAKHLPEFTQSLRISSSIWSFYDPTIREVDPIDLRPAA